MYLLLYGELILFSLSQARATQPLRIKTIEVGNVSLEATERDIKELFSLSGEIEYVEMQSCIHYLQGFASGKYAVEKAKTSDEKHQLTSKASPKVASFDRQDTRPLLVTK
ncbi:hypothetical protein V6N13_046917 [Hibiscus sabdariffa]